MVKETCFLEWSLTYRGASLVAQMVKNLPAVWETWVRSQGWEDPLEKGMALWRIPRTEEPDRLQSMGSQRVGHNRATFTFNLASRGLPCFFLFLQSSSGIDYFITYFVPLLCPCHFCLLRIHMWKLNALMCWYLESGYVKRIDPSQIALVPVEKKPQKDFSSLPLCEVTGLWAESRLSPVTRSSSTLLLDFPASRLCEK